MGICVSWKIIEEQEIIFTVVPVDIDTALKEGYDEMRNMAIQVWCERVYE